MDGQRFDQLSRGLAARLTRRRVLAGVLGLAFGGAVTAADRVGAAERRCRLAADKCVRDSQCCSGICDRRKTQQRSQRNRCICPPGEVSCGGYCRNPKTDRDHCGTCNHACPIGAVCRNGDCECPGSNQGVCDNACRQLGTVTDCGSCDDGCAIGGVCTDGECGCPAGQGVCDGACRQFGTLTDCTGCDDACPSGATCTANGCECPWAESGVCSNVCTEFGTKTNCTDCGEVCATGASCTATGCECDTAGAEACAGVCTPMGTSTDCLSCGDACGAGESCYASPTGCCAPSCRFKMDNETDGCSPTTYCPNPCEGVTISGGSYQTFVTVDGAEYIALNSNGLMYKNPMVSCTSDADCDECPATLPALGGLVPVGCGCDAFFCQFPAQKGKNWLSGKCAVYYNAY